MTPEGKVKSKVDQVLKHFGAYYHKPVVNGMGKPSLDYVCCYRGRFFSIETKAPGKDLTTRQEVTKSEMESAGGAVFKVSCKEELEVVIEWIQGVGNDSP